MKKGTKLYLLSAITRTASPFSKVIHKTHVFICLLQVATHILFAFELGRCMDEHLQHHFVMDSNYLHTNIVAISDKDIKQLLCELETVTGLPIHANSFLLHYLQDCLFPDETKKAVLITKRAVASLDPTTTALLSKKVKNLSTSEIYAVCLEVVKLHRKGLEEHEGKSLYAFINHFFKKRIAPRTNY